MPSPYPSPEAAYADLPAPAMAITTTHFDFSTLGAADWLGAATGGIGNGVTAELTNSGSGSLTAFGPDGATGIRIAEGIVGPGAFATRAIVGFDLLDLLPAAFLQNTLYLCMDVAVYSHGAGNPFNGWGLATYKTTGTALSNNCGMRTFKAAVAAQWPMIVEMGSGGAFTYTFNVGTVRRRIMLTFNGGTGLFEPWSSDTAGAGAAPGWADPTVDDFDPIPTMTGVRFEAPHINAYTVPPFIAFYAYGGNNAIDVTFTDLWVATVEAP